MKYIKIIIVLVFVAGCREPYNPPAVQTVTNYLVVESFINANDSSRIVLSRTKPLTDAAGVSPELKAVVTLEGESGGNFQFVETGNGNYVLPNVNLLVNKNYRLKIVTNSNSIYQSDFVPVKETPPIDTISWSRNGDVVTMEVNTHDPQNDTRYYRWEYEETWEYHAFYESFLLYENQQIVFRDSTQYTYKCYQSDRSHRIILGTSANLTEDIIQHLPLISIPRASQKIDVLYSILVKQYALTREAFDFWQLLQRNGEQGGSIFSIQPSQLIGNIHSVSKPEEPVIGYVSVSTVATKRVFIKNSDLGNWPPILAGDHCKEKFVPDSIPYYLSDTTMGPAYFQQGVLAIAKKDCMDCRRFGGTLTKPPFWR